MVEIREQFAVKVIWGARDSSSGQHTKKSCGYYGYFGHLPQECVKQKICDHCSRRGHIRRQCRKLKRERAKYHEGTYGDGSDPQGEDNNGHL